MALSVKIDIEVSFRTVFSRTVDLTSGEPLTVELPVPVCGIENHIIMKPKTSNQKLKANRTLNNNEK
jgi:hypothetical protein